MRVKQLRHEKSGKNAEVGRNEFRKYSTAGAAAAATLFAVQLAAAQERDAMATDTVRVGEPRIMTLESPAADTAGAASLTPAQSAAVDVVATGRMIDLLSGGAKTDADRAQEKAVLASYNNDRNSALTTLKAQQKAAIDRLYSAMVIDTTGSVEGSMKAEADAALAKVGKGAYSDYGDTTAQDASEIRSRLGASASVSSPAQTFARGEPVPRTERPIRTPRSIHTFHLGKSDSRQSAVVDPSPLFISELSGDRQLASDLGTALAAAYVVNDTTDLASVRLAAGQRVAAWIDSIPADNEMRADPNIQNARTAFNNGNLGTGFSYLTAASASFPGVFQSLNSIYSLSLNQQAVCIQNFGGTVGLESRENSKAWEQYLQHAKGTFPLHPVWLKVGGAYQDLLLNGSSTKLVPQMVLDSTGNLFVQTDSAGQPMFSRETTPLEGRARLVNLSIQSKFVFGIGFPVEWLSYLEGGYQDVSLGVDLPVGDTVQRVDVGKDEGYVRPWYIGLFQHEFRFPAANLLIGNREGKGIRLSFEAIGGGLILENPSDWMAYLAASGTWVDGKWLRWSTSVSPEYAHYANQHRLILDVLPFDLSVRGPWNSTVFGSPGYVWENNFTNGNQRHEIYGTTGWRFRTGTELDLRGSFIMEEGPAKAERVSQTGTVSVNLTQMIKW